MISTAARLAATSRLSALAALFILSLRQQVRGRRLLVLALLYVLPAGLALLWRNVEGRTAQFEFVLLLNLIPHAMVPLAALLYATGMIQDEIEDQTLTYLLIRSFSKRALYLIKLLAVFVTTIALAAVFATLTCLIVYWGSPNLWGSILPGRVLKIVGLTSLSSIAYCALFAFLSLFIRRALLFGVAYIIVFEGMLANVDFAVRRLTVVYYFRILAARWLDLPMQQINEWSLHLNSDPGAGQCVLVLLVASLAAGIVAAGMFASREFRLKTPEAS